VPNSQTLPFDTGKTALSEIWWCPPARWTLTFLQHELTPFRWFGSKRRLPHQQDTNQKTPSKDTYIMSARETP